MRWIYMRINSWISILTKFLYESNEYRSARINVASHLQWLLIGNIHNVLHCYTCKFQLSVALFTFFNDNRAHSLTKHTFPFYSSTQFTHVALSVRRRTKNMTSNVGRANLWENHESAGFWQISVLCGASKQCTRFYQQRKIIKLFSNEIICLKLFFCHKFTLKIGFYFVKANLKCFSVLS